jgi:pimeloyl-ACP methyl ester carboxylesterase
LNIRDIANQRAWTISNTGNSGGNITISGWDFGGEGELALLQHANGMCAAMWASVAQLLTPHYHVIALDARGHGDSEHLCVPDDYAWSTFVDDMQQVAALILQETGQSQIGLGLGSSYGGIVIAGTEAKFKGLFKRIVMLDPPIHATPELVEQMGIDFATDGSTQRQGLVEQTLKRKSIWPDRDTARTAWRNKPLFAAWHADGFSLYLDEGMRDRADGQVELKCDPTVEAHIFATTGSLGLLDYAPHVSVPVELVHAVNGFFPSEFASHIAATFPNCQLSNLDGGHMLPLEVPQAVVDLVVATRDSRH